MDAPYSSRPVAGSSSVQVTSAVVSVRAVTETLTNVGGVVSVGSRGTGVGAGVTTGVAGVGAGVTTGGAWVGGGVTAGGGGATTGGAGVTTGGACVGGGATTGGAGVTTGGAGVGAGTEAVALVSKVMSRETFLLPALSIADNRVVVAGIGFEVQ